MPIELEHKPTAPVPLPVCSVCVGLQGRVRMYVCMYPSGKGPAYSGPIR